LLKRKGIQTKLKTTAIVVAAGKSTRMNLTQNERNKPYLNICNKPILSYSLRTLEKSSKINEIIVVVSKEDKEYCENEIVKKFKFNKVRNVCFGGNLRQDSVYNGLKSIKEKHGIVLIHDGARPFLNSTMISKSIDVAKTYKASVVAVPVTDTVKYSTEGKSITSTLSRSKIWLIQTPQTFEYSIIMQAYERAYKEGFYGTDDSSLVERIGRKVKIIMGVYENIKITTKLDLVLAEAICKNLKLG